MPRSPESDIHCVPSVTVPPMAVFCERWSCAKELPRTVTLAAPVVAALTTTWPLATETSRDISCEALPDARIVVTVKTWNAAVPVPGLPHSEESEVHTVTRAVEPRNAIALLYSATPNLAPKTVTLADDVAAPFDGSTADTSGPFAVIALDTVPSCHVTVTCTSRIVSMRAEHCPRTAVSETHVVISAAEPPSRSCGDRSWYPPCRPTTVTRIPAVVGAFSAAIWLGDKYESTADNDPA